MNICQTKGNASVLQNPRSLVDSRVSGVNCDTKAHRMNFEVEIGNLHLPSLRTPHGVDARDLYQNPMMTQGMSGMNCLWMRWGYHI